MNDCLAVVIREREVYGSAFYFYFKCKVYFIHSAFHNSSIDLIMSFGTQSLYLSVGFVIYSNKNFDGYSTLALLGTSPIVFAKMTRAVALFWQLNRDVVLLKTALLAQWYNAMFCESLFVSVFK